MQAIYGPAFDGNRYLARFFDYRFGLSVSASKKESYIQGLAKEYGVGEVAVSALTGAAVNSNLDIRTIQQAMSSLRIVAIVMRTVNLDWLRIRRDYAHSWAATLALLRILDVDMYHRVLSREARTEDLMELFLPMICRWELFVTNTALKPL